MIRVDSRDRSMVRKGGDEVCQGARRKRVRNGGNIRRIFSAGMKRGGEQNPEVYRREAG